MAVHYFDFHSRFLPNFCAHTGATVEPFGSFVSNLFTRLGDLDVSVELMNGTCLSSAGKRRKQTLLGELLNALRQKGALFKLNGLIFYFLNFQKKLESKCIILVFSSLNLHFMHAWCHAGVVMRLLCMLGSKLYVA